jgi:L-ornithine N5-oxygenase
MSHDCVSRDYDVLGIGFGPSNIALAIAIEEAGVDLSVHFIEAAMDARWQPGMLLSGSDIQNHPLRDLVTPRNPKSHYTFVNYLKEAGRLYEFLNLGTVYPLRKDYSLYVTWVASHFAALVSYRTRATRITYDSVTDRWRVRTDNGAFTAKALVIGTGRSRNIPDIFGPHLGPRLFHLSDYVPCIEQIGSRIGSIAVLGASQSAVEIHLDLMQRAPDAEIHAIHRSFSMRQKDTSPFSDHVYFPDFIEYFFSAKQEAREELRRQLRPTNYSAADIDVLHRLYLAIYEERLNGRTRFHLRNNTIVESVATDETGVSLSLRERFVGSVELIRVDALVLATGFRDIGVGEGTELFPPILADVALALTRTGDGALLVERDYQVQSRTGLPLFLNGLCESSHGFGDAGSFSLLSLRASEILRSLLIYFEINVSGSARYRSAP